MGMITSSLKIAYKVALRRKFFTFISLFAICFTLVVLNVATAMLDATFGPSSPETNGARTVGIFRARLKGEHSTQSGLAGYGLIDQYARDLPNVEEMSIASSPSSSFSYENGQRMKIYARRTDGAYWRILDFRFVEGGPFSDADDRGGNLVAVINRSTRTRLFGDAPAVGRTFDLDGRDFRVVGVVEDVPMARLISFSEAWVPTGSERTDYFKKDLVGGFMGIILARDAADVPAIRAEFESRIRSAELPEPDQYDTIQASVATLLEFGAAMALDSEDGRGNSTLFITVLGVVMVLFMLLPTINLTNINMSRILERAPEIGVRKAFGASSSTLVGQFVVENVAITLAGSVAAFAVSQGVMMALSSSGIMPYLDLSLNYRVFAYGTLAALVFGLLSGAYPAWRMSRLDPVAALKGGVR
jgi:putative ABC transport system permease protein